MLKAWIISVTAALAITSCSQNTEHISSTKSGGNRPGEFKGYIYVNDFIKNRFLSASVANNKYFEMSRYFGESYPADNGLNSLLGRFSGSAGANEFRNGTPNSVNMLLWYIAGKSFGGQIATVCVTRNAAINPADPNAGNYMTLADDVFASILTLCSEGRDTVKFKEALEILWLATAGYDLPEAEMRAFIENFSTSDIFANLPPGDLVSTAVGAIVLNPYLILEN